MENMKKILFIIDTISAGGGTQKVLKIAMKILKSHGYLPNLVVLKKQKNELDFSEFDLRYILNKDEQFLPNSFKIIFTLDNLMKEYKIRAVFIDFITTYYASLAHALNKTTNSKIFCFVRTKLSELSKDFFYDELNLDLSKLALKSANKVIANSQICLEELINYGIKNPILLHNPLLLNDEVSDELDLPKNYALAIGRISPHKDYPTMIEAFNMASCKDLELLILGTGDLEIKTNNSKIKFLGYKKNILPYLKNAKFFIQTSLVEGSSNAVLESFSLGKPAILSKIEQNIEIYGNNALYANIKDVKGFAKAIKILDKKVLNFTPNLEKFSLKTFETKLLEIFS